MTEKERIDLTTGLAYLGAAAVLAGVFLAAVVFLAEPGPVRRWKLQREADEWGRKGVVMVRDGEGEEYRDFRSRYRREFGREWDAPAR